MSESLHELGLVAAVEAIRARRISSEELVGACLARIATLQPVLNAFIEVFDEAALQAARRADAALARGEPTGPLHGVPLAHKDLLYREGRICTGGSRILRDHPARSTATALARMDAAGAIEVGTLNMAEFAAGGTGHNEHYGDCHNPWGVEHATGGSSSGSGAAVAASLVSAALGSDTGGSVRLPAALCGITGLKPGDGRVSRHGVMPRSWTTDTLGPMARSVHDVARLLGVIAGHDPHDPTTLPGPVPDYEAALLAPCTGLRLGLPARGYLEHADAPVADAIDAARRSLEDAGMAGSTVAVPDPVPAFDLAEVVVKAEAASLHERWLRERPGDYSVAVRTPIEGGLYIPAARYLQALRLRAPLLAEFNALVFGAVDVLMLPVTPRAAPRLDACDPNSTDGASRTMAEFPRFTRPISYLGLPALVLPCGFDAAGLPLALQLVGPPGSEARLLQVGHHFQSVTDWHQRRPTL